MDERRVIAVVVATGMQGGGLVRAILREGAGTFLVRGLSRKVDSDNAKALTKLGAQMVTADLDDVDSLQRAFAGGRAGGSLQCRDTRSLPKLWIPWCR